MKSTRAPRSSELLDIPVRSRRRYASPLRNIARSHRWFGGAAAFASAPPGLIPGPPAHCSLTFLDVAPGSEKCPHGRAWPGARQSIRPFGGGRQNRSGAVAHPRGSRFWSVTGPSAHPRPRREMVLLSQVAHHFRRMPSCPIRECDRVARLAVSWRSPGAPVRRGRGSAGRRVPSASIPDYAGRSTSLRPGSSAPNPGRALLRACISAGSHVVGSSSWPVAPRPVMRTVTRCGSRRRLSACFRPRLRGGAVCRDSPPYRCAEGRRPMASLVEWRYGPSALSGGPPGGCRRCGSRRNAARCATAT